MTPLCIELFCGSFGWSAGWLAEGGRAVGFDIEHLPHHGAVPAGAKLVIQDVLTLHGSQFKDAAIILASPPCQTYSWLAMPWSRSKDPNNSKAAKALRAKWETEGPDNRLFDACFRIQREAIKATRKRCGCCSGSGRQLWKQDIPDCVICFGKGFTGERYIPLIVENVRGAQPWVGRSAWNFGSFHLWGDVPALMPIATAMKVPGFRFDGNGKSFQTASVEGLKRPGEHGLLSGSPGNTSKGFNNWPKDESGAYIMPDGTKIGGDWFSDPNSTCRKHGSRSYARKAASAQIAKIPLVLSSHIARVYKPRAEAVA